MKRILALDLATTTGWALRQPDGTMTSGVWDLGAPKPAHARYVALHDLLYQARLEQFPPPDVVAFEDVKHHFGTAAAHAYGGLRAIMLNCCAQRGIPYLPINVQHVKVAAGLPPAGKKAQVLAAARLRWPGVDFATDDEADARWIAEAAATKLAAMAA
jgi:Holliday junction resolvasome RuvABC endonuclease subunit